MLRKVKYKASITTHREGWFHHWANRIVYAEGTGDVTTPVALVEDKKTGEVKMVHPEEVQFLDKPEEDGPDPNYRLKVIG